MNSQKLNIFSSKEWMIPEMDPIVLLRPFWSSKELESTDPDVGRFASYISRGKEFFELVDTIEAADIAVYPQEYVNHKFNHTHLSSVAEQVAEKGKKLLVYYNSDDDWSIHIDNCIVFRTSFYQSKRQKNEYALPGWSVDFLNYFPEKKFTPVTDLEKPSVSYCGYVDYETRNLKDRIRTMVKPAERTHESRAKAIRGKACRILRKNDRVKTNFIIRNGFWAGTISDKNAARKEYAENMISSLYGVCTRGGGNFSYRFYELLSCGRIPLFINTDAVLPYDSIIDWKKHVVWVEEKELAAIDSILLKFHERHSQEQLKEMQAANRKLYEEYISPLGFHKHLHQLVKNA